MRQASQGFPTHHHPVCRIPLDGRIDYTALPRLKPLLRRIADGPWLAVEFDLARVEFVDSCGIGLLLAMRNAVRERGGRVRFENHSPRVFRILERSGIADLIAPPAAGRRAALPRVRSGAAGFRGGGCTGRWR